MDAWYSSAGWPAAGASTPRRSRTDTTPRYRRHEVRRWRTPAAAALAARD